MSSAEHDPINPRYHKPRVDRIVDLMKEHGLTRQACARKAHMSINTLRGILDGEHGQMGTFAKLAGALKTTPRYLMYDPVVDDSFVLNEAHVHYDGDFESINEKEDLLNLARALRAAIKGRGRIIIIDVEPEESFVLTVAMTTEDIVRLVNNFRAGKLRVLNIRALSVVMTYAIRDIPRLWTVLALAKYSMLACSIWLLTLSCAVVGMFVTPFSLAVGSSEPFWTLPRALYWSVVLGMWFFAYLRYRLTPIDAKVRGRTATLVDVGFRNIRA